jgi:hypothetical protein
VELAKNYIIDFTQDLYLYDQNEKEIDGHVILLIHVKKGNQKSGRRAGSRDWDWDSVFFLLKAKVGESEGERIVMRINDS